MIDLRLAVDGTNFANDRRGMGRYARMVVEHLRAEGMRIAFLTDDPRAAQILRGEFPADLVAPTRTARPRAAYDAAWFPFNGVRFSCEAPILVTMHDAFAFDEPARDFIGRRREQEPIRRAALVARRIHTDSEWSKSRLLANLRVPPERIAVVPLAPAPAFAVPAHPPAAAPSAPFVLLVGAREPRKNAAFFLRAFADAFADRPAIQVAIVGALSDEAEGILRARAIPHRREHPDDAGLRALYATARAVAVPSLGEGFGLVAVEAQACGAPVIASSSSALPEAVGDAGLLVDPHDRDAWVAGLRRIVDDEAFSTDLRARGAARWAATPRDGAARSVAETLRTLARDGRLDDRS